MSNPDGRAVEILLVEDNPGDVLLMQEAFHGSKVRSSIHVIPNGEQVMPYLRENADDVDAVLPDIIFLDLNLPRKDGREILGELKNDPGLKRIPVIVMTSSKAEADVLMSYNLHANSYVTKPMQPEAFREIVAAIDHFWFSVVVLPS